jgi:hypothetical protein
MENPEIDPTDEFGGISGRRERRNSNSLNDLLIT